MEKTQEGRWKEEITKKKNREKIMQDVYEALLKIFSEQNKGRLVEDFLKAMREEIQKEKKQLDSVSAPFILSFVRQSVFRILNQGDEIVGTYDLNPGRYRQSDDSGNGERGGKKSEVEESMDASRDALWGIYKEEKKMAREVLEKLEQMFEKQEV